MKRRKGWFAKAKRKWIKERLYSFAWYSSEYASIRAWIEWRGEDSSEYASIRAWIEWRGEVVMASRGILCPAEEQRAFEAIYYGDYFTARHYWLSCRNSTGACLYCEKKPKTKLVK